MISTVFAVVIVFTIAERMLELVVGKRNLAWSLSQGGVESGQGHWPWMVALHTGFIVAMVAEAAMLPTVQNTAMTVTALACAASAQGLRWWCIRTLGQQWNPRVVIIPGAARVTGGPYAFIPHPNYVAVALEGVALPMIHGCWRTAAVFTVLNAWLMVVRIRCENRALRQLETT